MMSSTMPINAQAKTAMTAAPQKSDPDSHLSDHEWRLKMSQEGKAIYVPGKTVEEMKAAKTEACTKVKLRKVGLTDEEWSALDTAIPDIIEVMHDVREMLIDLSFMGDLNKPGINSILRLASRAVQSLEVKEICILDRLDAAVRSSNVEAFE
jgi:hypothetical protein